MDKTNILIEKNSSLKSAIKKIEKNELKILFIIDKKKIIASLTDGDVRRYLLSGGKIEDTSYKAANHNPKLAHSKEEAIKLYKNGFIAVPILDIKGNLIDIYYQDSVKNENNKIKVPVVINAGGKGTRLEPYTKVLPKPLIPVGELPIIEHIMQRFESFGCNKFYTILNYKKELIKAFFKECDKKYNVTCINENEPLGTCGGLSLLKGKLDKDFFFVNCDTLLLSNYSDIYLQHIKNKSALTIVCANKKMIVPFGIIKSNKKNEYISMKEKPEYSFLTNIGFYIINEKVLNDINNKTKLDMPELIELEKKKGRRVMIYSVEEGKWLDMGQMSELERMRKTLYEE